MKIPSFLLAKLYVKGSLENVDDGFQFKILNKLQPTQASKVVPVKLNGTEYPLEDTTLTCTETVSAADVSEEKTFLIAPNVELTVHIKSEQLPEGEYTIDIGLAAEKFGEMAFSVKDTI